MHPLESKFDKQYKEALSITDLEFNIPRPWRSSALQSLRFASPISLGITAIELKNIRYKVSICDSLSCYEFAVLNNNIEARTQVELNLSDEIYDDLMIGIGELAEAWNQQTTSIRNAILAEISETQKATKN